MIPLTLQLKNFLSYGEQTVTVDFSPHHLMCLAGKNGHGKSALLDAMTWAVWGQARKVGGVPRDDMRLMRLGQRHMLVIFDFSCNQQRYQVKREMTISHDKAYSTLEFGLWDNATQAMLPLTDKTIRLTQQKIETMIGFTYESFTNSVFLRQGQSNEFSKKTARERKEVLSTILGLDRYERVRERLLEQARVAIDKKAVAEQLCARLTAESAREGQVRAALASCQQQIQDLTVQEQQLIAQQQDVRTQLEELATRKEQVSAAHARLAHVQEQARSYSLSLQLVGAQQRNSLDVQHVAVQAQQQALREKQQSVQARLHVLVREQAQIQASLAQLHAQTQEHAQAVVRVQAAQRLWEKRKALYHKMVGYAHWVNRELADAQTRHQQAHDSAQPTCPLCEQALPNERQQFLCAKLAHRQGFYEHRLQRVSQFLRVNKVQLEREQKQIAEFAKQADHQVQGQTQTVTFNERLAVIDNESQQLSAQLLVMEREAIMLAARYEEVCRLLRDYEVTAQQQLSRDAQYCALQQTISEVEKQCVHLGAGIDAQAEQRNKLCLRELEQKMGQRRDQKQTLLHQQGGLERDMQQLVQIRSELTVCTESLCLLDTQIVEQRAIADAFGKDGVQALLIESIIPELEAEANALLARLSDQNTQVFIESLRDLKKGGARETLDINIADTMGIRPYELFSGGEAFRIDFALRVAISKLLARRAGAALQTLIIDEGFGSQDEDGLSLIMDVLHRVQADFAKIIIVSHLSSLKEQFPVHLVVEKDVQGSHVRMVEQG